MGKNGNVLNQFLLLGFGSSGKELSANYTITSEGTEKVGSADTTKLLLDPKDAGGEGSDRESGNLDSRGSHATRFSSSSTSLRAIIAWWSTVSVVFNPAGVKVELKLPPGAKKQKKVRFGRLRRNGAGKRRHQDDWHSSIGCAELRRS